MNPTFYKITVCQIITLFGNAALRFALPLYLLRRTDSAALYGSVTALALVPMLLGTLAGGVLADRCRKQKIMAVLDTVSAIGMAAAAAAMLGVPVTPLVLAALCLLYAVEGLYQPAVQASLPLLLDGAALARGNAVIQLVDTIDELLGPLLGSVLLHTLELRGLLLLCAVCFAVSALWERTLPIPHAPAARSDQRLPPKALFLQARPLLRLAMVLALLNLAVVPAFTVGVPLLIVRYYAFSDTALAVTQSAMSAGGLLGGVLAGAFAKRLFLRRGTAALWCITAVCALLGLAVLPCVPAAAGYIAVRSFGTHKNIMLTSEQYNELESRCRSVGLSLESYISKLSQWLFTKGRHCTDPYRIISGWLDNDSKRKTAAKPKERQGCDLSWYDDFAMNFDLSKFF